MGDTEDAGTATTKDRILDAAERLFGERGFAGTSLRALTEAAGVNVAAVNYHFGSKEGLLRAVAGRAMASVNAERRRLLEELESRAAKPGLDELIQAFVGPGTSLVARHGPQGKSIARFIGRVMFEPDPQIRRLFAAEVGPTEGRYLQALARALPHLPADEVAFRYQAMVGLIALHQAGTLPDLQPPGHLDSAQDDDTTRLITLITGAFRAPATQGTHLAGSK